MKKFIIITILATNLLLSCNPINKNEKKVNKLILKIHQEDNIVRIINPKIYKSDSLMNVEVKIRIPINELEKLKQEKISLITIGYNMDTLILAKPLNYLLCNRPDSNSFFLTINGDSMIYGKNKGRYFSFYILNNIDNQNELKSLKKYVVNFSKSSSKNINKKL